jgi:hypothetical protein
MEESGVSKRVAVRFEDEQGRPLALGRAGRPATEESEAA